MVSTLCKALTVVAIVFAVAFVIVGGILPTVLNNVINSSVKSSLVLSASDLAANNDKYTKWAKNTDVNIDYYFFNITNLDDALSTGNKLKVQEVGPYSYQKVIVRFNVTFPDATQVRYFEWIYFVPKFQAGKDPTVDMVTIVNFPWLLAVGSTAFYPMIGVPPLFDAGDNDQVTTFMYGLYVKALGTIGPIFLNATTSPFLSVVRFNMIPNMINYLSQTFDSPTQFVSHFGASPKACTVDADCGFSQAKCINNICGHVRGMGVDIHQYISPNATQFLFNTTGVPYSFSNFSYWSPTLTAFTADPTKIPNPAYWPPSLVGVFNTTDMINFVTWVGGLLAPTNANYASVCSAVMQASQPAVALAFNNFTTWSDYGIFQFATGGIVLQLTKDPAHKSLADLPGSPLPVGPEPFKMPVPNNAMNYATAMRLLTYTIVGIGTDSVLGVLTPQDRQYMFYVVNNFAYPTFINPSAKGGLFTTRTANELLWGYVDAFLPFPGWAGNSTTQDEAWLDSMTQPNIKYTGSDDISKVHAWKNVSGQSVLTNMQLFPNRNPPCVPGQNVAFPVGRFGYAPDCSLWSSPEYLDGSSDGTNTAPFKEGNPAATFPIYVSEALRVVPFLYRGDVTYKGITLNNYTIDQNALMSSATYPPNAKYWMNESDLIIPIIRYWGGADVFLSNPHFLSASPTLFAALTAGFDATNVVPDYSKHQSYVLTEPLSGITMSVHKRLMSGIKLTGARLSPIENPTNGTLYAYDKYSKLWSANGIATKIYLPTFWADEYGSISDSDASSFTNSVYQTRNVAKGIQIAFVIFGGLGLVVIAIFFYRQSKSTTTS